MHTLRHTMAILSNELSATMRIGYHRPHAKMAGDVIRDCMNIHPRSTEVNPNMIPMHDIPRWPNKVAPTDLTEA